MAQLQEIATTLEAYGIIYMETPDGPSPTGCDACGTSRGPLIKLSLGKDFFGRAYDRLTPSSDLRPKWYCEICSTHKNLQRDVRDIQAEMIKWTAGQPSEVDDSGQLTRIQLRLQDTASLLEGEGADSPFLRHADVCALLHNLEPRLSSSGSQSKAQKF